MTLHKLAGVIRKAALGLAMAGATLFQAGTCTVEADLDSIEELLCSACSDSYDPDVEGSPGIEASLPYFDQGAYSQAPWGLF